MKDKIKSFFIKFKLEDLKLKEYEKNKPNTPLHDKLCKSLFIATIAIYILLMFVTCPINASAQEEENIGIMPTADEPSESVQVVIPSGVYIGKPFFTNTDINTLISLGTQTYNLPEGLISYSCIQEYASNPSEILLGQPFTDLLIVVESNSLTGLYGICNNALGNSAFLWNPDYSFNAIMQAFLESPPSNVSVPFSSIPIISVPTDVSADADIATAFNAIFVSVGSGSGSTPPQECPTVEELLANMSGQDALQALYNSNADATMIIAQGAADAYNNGKVQGVQEGIEYGLEQSGKFSGNLFTDIVGNVMGALDGFVIYQDALVTVSLLTVIRSLIAVFALIWILKLIAGG